MHDEYNKDKETVFETGKVSSKILWRRQCLAY